MKDAKRILRKRAVISKQHFIEPESIIGFISTIKNVRRSMMRIKSGEYNEGMFTLLLVDKNNKPLGIFIATNIKLIKSLRKDNLSKIKLMFEDV